MLSNGRMVELLLICFFAKTPPKGTSALYKPHRVTLVDGPFARVERSNQTNGMFAKPRRAAQQPGTPWRRQGCPRPGSGSVAGNGAFGAVRDGRADIVQLGGSRLPGNQAVALVVHAEQLGIDQHAPRVTLAAIGVNPDCHSSARRFVSWLVVVQKRIRPRMILPFSKSS